MASPVGGGLTPGADPNDLFGFDDFRAFPDTDGAGPGTRSPVSVCGAGVWSGLPSAASACRRPGSGWRRCLLCRDPGLLTSTIRVQTTDPASTVTMRPSRHQCTVARRWITQGLVVMPSDRLSRASRKYRYARWQVLISPLALVGNGVGGMNKHSQLPFPSLLDGKHRVLPRTVRRAIAIAWVCLHMLRRHHCSPRFLIDARPCILLICILGVRVGSEPSPRDFGSTPRWQSSG